MKLTKWFYRRRFLDFVKFCLLFQYLPLEKDVALHLSKFKSPLSKDALCWVLLKLAVWFLRTRFLNFLHVFSLFRNSPWKRVWSFLYLTNPLHPRMHCAKFGWNWSSCSSSEDEKVKSSQTDKQTDWQTNGEAKRCMTDNRGSEKLTWDWYFVGRN